MKIVKDGESLENAIEQSFKVGGQEGDKTGVMSEELSDVKKMAAENRVDIIDLPSHGYFYQEDGLMFRPFKFREYRLLSAAQSSDSFKSLAEAVSFTVLNFDGKEMTFQDFKYLLYRHRLQMNRPFEIIWHCSSEDHALWNEQGWMPVEPSEEYPDGKKPIDPRRIEQSKRLTKSDITVTHPNAAALREYLNDQMAIEEGLYLYPTRVADSIELEDERNALIKHAAQVDMDADELQALIEELEFDSGYAMILNPNKHGKTLKERREWLREWMDKLPAEDTAPVLEKLARFLNDSDHEVEESVKVKCEVCGAEERIAIAFSPADFFPEVQERVAP